MKIWSLFVFSIALLIGIPNSAFSKNCDVGKQCGDACISKDKICRLGAKPYHSPKLPSPKLTPTYPRTKSNSSAGAYYPIPSEKGINGPSSNLYYIVIADTVMARKSPTSEEITGSYRAGQEVVAYQLHNSWARVNNSYPSQWIELKYLARK